MRATLAALAASAVLAGAGLFYARGEPGIPLLPEAGRALWLASPAAINLQTWAGRDYFLSFRKRFTVGQVPERAVLTLYFMKDAAVRLDGRVILAPSRDLGAWKTPKTVDLAPLLSPGEHELMATVLDRSGPPLLAASCPALELFSGPDWETSVDLKDWAPARLAEEFRPAVISGEFPSSAQAFASLLPAYAVVFAVCLSWSRLPGPGKVRWFLLAAAAALGVNDVLRLPAGIGMDVTDHLDYIRYVAQRGRLPLAGEGWQMFQAPLYYIVSAPLYRLASSFAGAEACEKAMRIVPVACWLGTIEVTYRFLRLTLPGRPDLQAAGLVLGALLPMNIYVSQFPGNEPLAAFLCALAIYLAAKEHPWTGAVLGLALLTKVSAFLLVLPLLWLMSRGAKGRRRLPFALLSAGLICGWFYARNQIYLGRAFIAPSWGSVRDEWWQEPGYRSLREFYAFGQALRRPIYSGLNGFWDSLYSTFWLDGNLSGVTTFRSRPPWNYSFMIASAWWALVPTAAIGLGLLRRGDRALRFSAACVLLYLAAMMALYLRLPIYSTGKASYMSGLTPCFALLGAAGLDLLTRKPAARRLVYAALSCWALSAYLSFWA